MTAPASRPPLRVAPAGLLLALVVLALAVRIPHLDWGLPDVEEEALPAKKAFEMWGWDTGRVDLDPGTAGWPSLSFHVHLALQAIERAVGSATGRYHDPLDFYVEYQRDPTAVMLWARGLAVVLSSILVVVAARMGRRLAGTTGAAAAGALVALSPMMVRHAQMIEPDMLLSVFAALAMARLLDVLERGRTRDYVITAVFCGLGAASKYTPVLLTISLYATHLHRLRREGRSWRWLGLDDRRIGWAALASVLAFCVGSPYTFADLDVLRRDVAYQLMHMSEGHFGHTDQGIGYVHYLGTVLPRALGWPGLVVALCGLWIAARRSGAAPALTWAFLPYFLVLGSLSTHFDRYMMPLVVPLAVAAGLALQAATGRWATTPRRAIAISTVALLLVSALPAVQTVRHHRVQSVPSTQRAAADWILANLPPETTTMVVERYGPNLPEDLREALQARPVFARLDEGQRQTLLDRPFYRFQILPMYSARVQLTGYYYDLRHFLAYDAIVVSGSVRNRYLAEPGHFPRQVQFYADLDRYCEVAARFEPGGRARGPQIVVYRWRAGGTDELLAERGALAVDHYLEFAEKVHAPDFLGFTEAVATHAEFEQRWDVAATYYEVLTETAHPDDRPWFFERAGICAISAGHLDRAEAMFEALLARDPRSVVALGNMGLIAERRGDRDAARGWYERCLSADTGGRARSWVQQRMRALGETGTDDQRR